MNHLDRLSHLNGNALPKQTVLFASQPRFDLHSLSMLRLHDIFLARVKGDMHLVERVVLALFELLLDDLDALLSAQAGVLLFNLGQPQSLKGRVSSLVSALWVSVDRRAVRMARQRQGVERIVDARRV